ncbi:MAG: hypothetical protein KGV46_01590 [Pasteurella sp.]|nr:hypothetical protein [Pasteurella sp.]
MATKGKTSNEKDTQLEESTVITVKTPTSLKELVNELKRKAMFKRIVTVTYNDKRDSDVTTTAYLTSENQYFGISRIVPLGIPVEIEQCLIDSAKEAEIVTHVPEILNGRRTGNVVPKLIKKYNISYEMQNG